MIYLIRVIRAIRAIRVPKKMRNSRAEKYLLLRSLVRTVACNESICAICEICGRTKISLAALHTEGAEDGSEDSDDEVDYFLNCFLFHVN